MHFTPIIAFYLGRAPDHRGRMLDQLQSQSLESLERNHDYIQWLFPLPERSSANPNAPLLLASDLQEFADREELRSNLLRSFGVMLHFYGLRLDHDVAAPEIRPDDSFPSRSAVWLTPFNHNFLRLTRIVRSLSLLGCRSHADALLQCLEEIYRKHPSVIGVETFQYWKSAAR
jgi:hypothetical protein